jgi:hypothetical protein
MTSPFDGRSRRPLAWLLAILCTRELVLMASALGWTAPAIALTCAGAVAVVLFARRWHPIACGVVALTALSVLSQLHALAEGGPMRHEFAVGVALFGWLCGLGWARSGDAAVAEPFAEMGAASALAATYVDAGISKLLHGNWAESSTLRAMLVAHRRVDDLSLAGRYARLIVENAHFAQALSWATLVVQLGAVLYLFAPRWLWGTFLLIFHLHVAFLTGIYYWGAMYLLALFSYRWPRVLGSS